MISEHKKIISLTFGIAIALTLIAFSLILIFNSPPLEKPNTPQYTTSYENINVSLAKELIATNSNLTIVDCSGGCQECTWKNGAYLPRARWIEFPWKLYDSTYDILVYSQSGQKSANFCEQLLNHVYGKIYNLKGGYIAWRKEE